MLRRTSMLRSTSPNRKFLYLGHLPASYVPTYDEWELGGTQWEKPALYEKFNPLNHVEKWKTPMLVVQGALDYRVGSEHAIGIFTALQRRGMTQGGVSCICASTARPSRP